MTPTPTSSSTSCAQALRRFSLEHVRPDFPRGRRHVLENGVERVSMYDGKACNLMVLVVKGTAPRATQDQKGLHNVRNIRAGMERLRSW